MSAPDLNTSSAASGAAQAASLPTASADSTQRPADQHWLGRLFNCKPETCKKADYYSKLFVISLFAATTLFAYSAMLPVTSLALSKFLMHSLVAGSALTTLFAFTLPVREPAVV